MGQLVEVAHFFDPEEAICAASYLRARGIETIIQNEHHLTAAPWLRVALDGYPLLAPSELESKARAALNDIQQIKTTHSSEALKPRNRNWLWLPIALISTAPFIPIYRSRLALALQIFLAFWFLLGITYSIFLWIVADF